MQADGTERVVAWCPSSCGGGATIAHPPRVKPRRRVLPEPTRAASVLHNDLSVHPRMWRTDVVVIPGSLKVIALEAPFTRSPASHIRCVTSVAVWAGSPRLVQVTVVPFLMRMRAGPYANSRLLLLISTLSAPSIEPLGPAIVGGGGGYRGCNAPLRRTPTPHHQERCQ